MHRRLVVWATLTAALAAAPALLAAPPAHANWSAPAQLRGCASALSGAPPLVVFPSSAPSVRSGPGMVLWEGGAACGGTGGVGVAAPQALTAPIEADGLPGAGRALGAVGAGLASVAAAVGTTFGQVLVAGTADLPDTVDLPGPAGGRAAAARSNRAAGASPTGAAGATGGRTPTGVRSPTAEDAAAYVEGRAPGAFSTPRALGGPPSPVATFGGYLGDAALASAVRDPRAGGWALAIRVQRHYASTPNRVWRLPTGGRPSAVAVTMDYRSDVLAVWAAHGTIAAQEITQAGVVGSTEVLGAVAGVPELRALFSDDGRAIVAWRVQASPAGAIRARARTRARESATENTTTPAARAASAASTGGASDGVAAQSTTIALDVSGPDLSFGRPTRVERFADLPGLPLPSGSLRLTRMSSEAVMMAWTGRSRSGRYVVRASPVSLRRGAWAPVTVSGAAAAAAGSGGGGAAVGGGAGAAVGTAGSGGVGATPGGGERAGGDGAREAGPREALLAELVPGPRAEVLALWVSVPRLPDGTLAAGRRAIVAAWGHYGGHGEAQFAAPETVAAPGPNGTPAAAFDPDSDRALAAWMTGLGTARPRIVYAQRTPGPPAPPTRRLAVAVPVSAPMAQVAPPPASGRVLGTAGDPRAGHAPSHRTGSSPVWAGVGLLLFAAAAAYREIGRRRGWVGARRA